MIPYDWIKNLKDEMIQASLDYMSIKNELEYLLAVKLEDIFDDIVCIECYSFDDKVYFELDMGAKKYSEEQLKQVEERTHSKLWMDKFKASWRCSVYNGGLNGRIS